MTKLLISITNLQEAAWALEADVDIIDLKNPSQGALGALPLETVRQVVDAVDSRKTISATIGDLPMQPSLLVERVTEMAATAVDIVKVGFLPSGDNVECIEALGSLAQEGIKIVAVLAGDLEPDFSLLPAFKAAGFFGVMLDTFYKEGKCLLDHLSIAEMEQFVITVNRMNMQSGLAGSLQSKHIQLLGKLAPGYLGFRGAVCIESDRRSIIDPIKISELKMMLYKYNESLNFSNVVKNSQALDCNANAVSV